jgi:hypothetical protein
MHMCLCRLEEEKRKLKEKDKPKDKSSSLAKNRANLTVRWGLNEKGGGLGSLWGWRGNGVSKGEHRPYSLCWPSCVKL